MESYTEIDDLKEAMAAAICKKLTFVRHHGDLPDLDMRYAGMVEGCAVYSQALPVDGMTLREAISFSFWCADRWIELADGCRDDLRCRDDLTAYFRSYGWHGKPMDLVWEARCA